MSLIYNGTTVKKVNYNGTSVKKVVYNGTTVWKAEQSLSDMALPIMYAVNGSTGSNTSTTAYNLSKYQSISFTYSGTVTNMIGEPAGVHSTATMFLKLNDGTTVQIAQKSGVLTNANATYAISGSTTISLSGYSANQLSSVHLYGTLGDVYALDGSTGDELNFSGKITSVIANY